MIVDFHKTIRKGENTMLKELYETPELEIVEFENEDIVTDSNELPAIPF